MTLASSNEKNTGSTPGPWMIVPPGGPQGPFYGLINSQGNVVSLQIVGEANAHLLVAAPDLLYACRILVRLIGIIQPKADQPSEVRVALAAMTKAEAGEP